MHFTHPPLLIIAGTIWLLVGLFLLTLGLTLLVHPAEPSLLFHWLTKTLGQEEMASIVLIAFSLIVGRFKGRFVLQKSVLRMHARLLRLGTPLPLWKIFSPAFYILILFMIGLGLLMRWLNLPSDLRGVIDLAVGSALTSGAVFYFRLAAKRGP